MHSAGQHQATLARSRNLHDLLPERRPVRDHSGPSLTYLWGLILPLPNHRTVGHALVPRPHVSLFHQDGAPTWGPGGGSAHGLNGGERRGTVKQRLQREECVRHLTGPSLMVSMDGSQAAMPRLPRHDSSTSDQLRGPTRTNRRGFLAVASGLAASACPGPASVEADICVYGGTSGGVAAAVTGARLGRSVVLVEAGRHLGGMTAGGLSATDIGNPMTVGGVAREYYTRLAGQYGQELPWTSRMRGVPTGGAFAVEPSQAERLFEQLVQESGVPVFRDHRIVRVRKDGPRIKEAFTSTGLRLQAAMFIDATYEGDLMALAGVRHTVSRESNDAYGETLNGVMFSQRYRPTVDWGVAGPNGRRHDGKGLWDRDLPLDPYVTEGSPQSGLLPLVDGGEVGPPGAAAPGVQAYCYRLCLTRDPANRLPLERPGDYDAGLYELVARFIRECVAAGDDMDLRWFSKHDPLPGGKYDFNTATFGGNLPGASWDWPLATASQRRSIAAEHESYHRGLLHFLATDERVPPKVRRQMSEFGLCRDEFPETGGWPHQIYVREGRRMVSDFVLTQSHCQGEQDGPEPVGLGSYSIDLHEIRRVVRDGMVWREGKGGGRVPRPYPIPYGTIVPSASEVTNLLVTFAISATHVAYGSTRMEPVFMILSQSAATAADLALEEQIGVQGVSYPKLAARLIAGGQVLEAPHGTTA